MLLCGQIVGHQKADLPELTGRAGHPRFFRAFAANKKAREREEKKARKKAKAPSAKEKKREFALFCLWGVVCMYVCVCIYRHTWAKGNWERERKPVARKEIFFPLFFLCSKEHFAICFVQYLGVMAGIEPAT
jgi:hypothetical protein